MTTPAEQSEKLTCGEFLLLALLWPLALFILIMSFGQEWNPQAARRLTRRIFYTFFSVLALLSIGPLAILIYIFFAQQQAPLGYVLQGIIAGVFMFLGLLIVFFTQTTQKDRDFPPMDSSAQRFLSIQSIAFWAGLLLWVLLGAQMAFPTYAGPLKIAFCGLAGLWVFVFPLINTTSSLLRRQRASRSRE